MRDRQRDQPAADSRMMMDRQIHQPAADTLLPTTNTVATTNTNTNVDPVIPHSATTSNADLYPSIKGHGHQELFQDPGNHHPSLGTFINIISTSAGPKISPKRYTLYLLQIIHVVVVVYPHPWPLLVGGSPMFPLVVHQPASPSIWPAVQSLRRGLSTNPWVTMWCVCGCSWRDDVCRVCGCYRGGIVVMDVFWRRLCVRMIWGREICFFCVGQGCDEWGGKSLFRAANVWWRCAQYVVIASCG